MNVEDKHSLWFDQTKSRYFLIRDKQELPIGDFILYTLTGNEKKVALKEINTFEITAEDAQKHLQAEMKAAMEQAKTAYSNWINFSAQTATKSTSESNLRDNKTQSTQELVAALLGITSEELQTNPEATQTGLLNFFTGLKAIATNATPVDPTQAEAFRNHLSSFSKALQAQGIEGGDVIAQIQPDQLNELIAKVSQDRSLQEMLVKLQQCVSQIDVSKLSLGQSIDEVVKLLSKAEFLDPEARLQAKQQQKYRESAQSAIARSLRAHGITPSSLDNPASDENNPIK